MTRRENQPTPWLRSLRGTAAKITANGAQLLLLTGYGLSEVLGG